MDVFTHELGPAYVPAFASRLLLAMGKGLAGASEAMQRAFDEEAEDLWTLALIVVRWHADALPVAEAKAVASALPDPEMVSMLANLHAFREPLLAFVAAAHRARTDAQLAAAGIYFINAVEQIGLPMLSAAIKAGPVMALGTKLRARLPLPDDVKVRYDQIRRESPKSPVTLAAPKRPARVDRSERFDRADRGPRAAKALPQLPGTRVAAKKPVRAPPEPAPSATTPQLASAEVTRAYLHVLGWHADEVERLLRGPAGKTAE